MTERIELSQSVHLERDGDVAVVVVDNPPVNALSHHVRQGLLDGLTQAGQSDASAIVLVCAGRTFIAGADISEFGSAPQGPSLQAVQDAIESNPKPVVAAIHGTALGGGLEVALCAHFRVAVPGAKFGLPEVNLGLLPGAGGTQRLPRVVGVPKALAMMTSGDPIGTDEAEAAGLIDAIVDGDGPDALRAGAVAFAAAKAAEGAALTKIRDRDELLVAHRDDRSAFDAIRAKIARKTRGFLAPEYNIRCIEAAVDQPFDEGLATERTLFGELMSGTQSAAQRYAFFAERAANKIVGLSRDTLTRPIERVGVLGAGTMGGGIAMNFVNVGIPVTIVEREPEPLERGLGVVRKNYERSVKSGRLTMDDVDARMDLITGSTEQADFADCDLIIEAVFEDMGLKKTIFANLDKIAKPGAILASNTSALDLNEIASATSRPADVVGLHFFSPANVMKLVEVVRGDDTADDVLATSMAISKKIGKAAALSGVCHGFIGNRMLFQRGIEANKIILEGATPAQVDRVLYDFGLPMGPFAMSDLAGLDIGWKAETSSSSNVREILCESGRRGQKNGKGYYTYDPETRASTPDPEVEQMIRDFAVAQGIEQREVTDQEVLERCLYPMVNEGAKILDEGIAQRGSDIDVVWVHGYGWPVYRGGPMFWADTVGLSEVADAIEKYSAELGGTHWELSPLLRRLADEGGALQSYEG
ncbi:MAG: 3-hydroxyacyl-CoA dehydrogenase NAD-binding domain-containing protein [Acidimicrobiales bacterium]